MDPIDQACKREQDDREIALKAQAAKPHMQPTGLCYNCDAVIFEGCFCNSDCRDDFEYREKLINRQGVL